MRGDSGFARKEIMSWPRNRRVVVKTVHLVKDSNPRFVVLALKSEKKRAEVFVSKSIVHVVRRKTGSRNSSHICLPAGQVQRRYMPIN